MNASGVARIGQDLDELEERLSGRPQPRQKALAGLDVIGVDVRHPHDRSAVERLRKLRRGPGGHDAEVAAPASDPPEEVLAVIGAARLVAAERD